jgi:hypothetical protein
VEAVAARPPRFEWRTVWLYFAVYPLASTAGLAVFFVWSEAMNDGPSLGLEFSLFMAVFTGVLASLVPAFVAGLLAAVFHRPGEPPWRSAIIGVGAGVLAAEFFPLLAMATMGAERVDAMMDSENGSRGLLISSLCAGVFAGLCFGLAQAWRVKPKAA